MKPEEVVALIRRAKPDRRHPAVVFVRRDRSVLPMVNVLRSAGLDAADGRWRQIAAVRVYPKDAAAEAAAFVSQYHPARQDYKFIWA